MSKWSKDELRRISETDDLHIAPFREDGKTYGTPTWIWSVVVDDALYVREHSVSVAMEEVQPKSEWRNRPRQAALEGVLFLKLEDSLH